MAYTKRVDSANPGCFIFLIDQSGSMDEVIGGLQIPKKQCVADAINKFLANLVIAATSGERVKNWFDIGVIGYGTTVGPAFTGALTGKRLVKLSDVAHSPAKIDVRTKSEYDGAGDLTEKKVRFPIWFEPQAGGPTPMAEAMHQALEIVQGWAYEHQNSYPPIVINITDGEATDDPSAAAAALGQVSTKDGNTLLFNCHVSNSAVKSILFPSDEALLPDDFARQLFAISSTLPLRQVEAAQANGFEMVDPRSRGFVFNADVIDLIKFIDVGTVTRAIVE